MPQFANGGWEKSGIQQIVVEGFGCANSLQGRDRAFPLSNLCCFKWLVVQRQAFLLTARLKGQQTEAIARDKRIELAI